MDVNEAAVSELSGKVSEKDFGLFVSAGGINKRATTLRPPNVT
jgi:hypothetical protein